MITLAIILTLIALIIAIGMMDTAILAAAIVIAAITGRTITIIVVGGINNPKEM
jgi:hypothetical protein